MADEEITDDGGVTEELPADAVQEEAPVEEAPAEEPPAEEEAPVEAEPAELPPPKSNVWTLLLVLSCVFMLTGIILIGNELHEFYHVNFWVMNPKQ